jgi:hypothetical protein
LDSLYRALYYFPSPAFRYADSCRHAHAGAVELALI